MRRSVLDRLHGAAIRVQLPVVLAAIPVTTATYGLVAVSYSTGVAVSLLVTSVALATTASGMLLRGSLRSTVEQLQLATDAIASGDFRHRVDSGRSDELGALAASIDVMAERLERLEQARRRMLACVSHELRTPLTIIQGHAFTLARHEEDVVRLERLEMMQAEATRLAGLVGDLVEAASLHAGGVRLRPEACDLGDLVASEVDRFLEEAAQRDVRITLVTPAYGVPVEVDPGRIGQSVANLLANAVRHADVGSEVAVHVDGRRGGARSITVTNRCEPIPDDVADQLFEPFVQASARSGSVGLGLAIVRAIVVAHGGSVRLDRAAAAGGTATFTLELPAPHRAARLRSARRPSRRPARTRLLAAET